jgi:hypothetical protein
MYNKKIIKNAVAPASDKNTLTADLSKLGLITAIDIAIACTNGTTNNKYAHIHNNITNIRVVGGGADKWVNATGYQIMRLNHFDTGKQHPMYLNEGPSIVQREYFRILFGRKFGDSEYGLDPSWYPNNLSLEVDFDMTLTSEEGATQSGVSATVGWATQTLAWTVIAHHDPELIGKAKGCLATVKDNAQTTTAANTLEFEINQRDAKLRRVMVECFETLIDDGTDVTAYEIDPPANVKYVNECNWVDTQAENEQKYGIEPIYRGIVHVNNADVVETHAGTLEHVTLVPLWVTATAATDNVTYDTVASMAGGTFTLNSITKDGDAATADAANTTEHYVFYTAKGKFGVGNAIMIDLTPGVGTTEESEKDWLDGKTFEGTKVILTQGGAGGSLNILKQFIALPGAGL